MIGVAVKLCRAVTSVAARSASLGPTSHSPGLRSLSSSSPRPPPSRWLHDGINGSDANPVALQMINYAVSYARSQKSGSTAIFSLWIKLWIFFPQCLDFAVDMYLYHFSDESYAQGLLVLEQCLSTQSSEGQNAENSRGLVLLAMATLFSERFSSFYWSLCLLILTFRSS